MSSCGQKSHIAFWAGLLVLLGGIMCPYYSEGAGQVRRSPIAGSWYPGTAKALTEAIDGYIKNVKSEKPRSKPLALIMPHAGYRYCGPVAAHCARLLNIGDFERVFIIGPSHRGGFRGASVPTYSHYETPLGKVELDGKIRDALLGEDVFTSHNRLHANEHSIEIELPWLQRRLGNFKFIPIMVSGLDEKLSRKIADAIKPFVDEKTLIIASSDFVHYGRRFGYVTNEKDVRAFIERIDMGAAQFIEKLDVSGFHEYFRWTNATICGRDAISVLMNLMDRPVKVRRLAYAMSADESKDYSSSVSYMAMAFFAADGGKSEGIKAGKKNENRKAGGLLNKAEQDYLIKLARESVTSAVRDKRLLPLEKNAYADMPCMMEKRGVFVTLHKGGRLRGCIGYIKGHAPLAIAIRNNAVSAALKDPRFKPVTEDELKDIHIEVSVLTPLKRIRDPNKVVAGTHGVYLIYGSRSAVYLPQVATEQGWNREQFLKSLCASKAGLPEDTYLKPEAELYTFKAQIFQESK